jgi:hypothetical protein
MFQRNVLPPSSLFYPENQRMMFLSNGSKLPPDYLVLFPELIIITRVYGG